MMGDVKFRHFDKSSGWRTLFEKITKYFNVLWATFGIVSGFFVNLRFWFNSDCDDQLLAFESVLLKKDR